MGSWRHIYYKDTNSHDYLQYDSHHPEHTRKNIPFNLAKKIIVFCSNSETEKERLSELKTNLLKCKYPEHVIGKAFHNAKLQGPSPNPNTKKNILPFVTTYHSNLDSKRTVSLCNDLLQNSRNERIKTVFNDCSTILSLRQPPNILRQITCAIFPPNQSTIRGIGLFKCNDVRCKLCRLYIQECKSFIVANGTEWMIKTEISCQSKMVLYYLVCNPCKGKVTSTGKTNCFRKRMNCHISECRTGNTTEIFDLHVHGCMKKNNMYTEPYFKIYVYMEVFDERKLIPYESHLHDKKFDTMN